MVNVTFLPIYNDKSQLLGGCLVIMYQQCSLRKVFVLFCWSVVVTNKIHKREDRGRWGAEVIVCSISWLFGAHFQNMSLEDNFPATSFNASLNTDILAVRMTWPTSKLYWVFWCEWQLSGCCCHHYDHYHHHLCCCCHCHHHW